MTHLTGSSRTAAQCACTPSKMNHHCCSRCCMLWMVTTLSRGFLTHCSFKMVTIIRIASSDQVQRQQQRDEPVRENTHLMLDTLASRLRSYHSIVGVKSLVFQIIRTQLIYIQSIVCMDETISKG